VGLLIDLDVVAKPVDLHRLWWAHGLACEVEGSVFSDIQLLRLTNEVWEPCTDASKETRIRDLSNTALSATSNYPARGYAQLQQQAPSHPGLPISGQQLAGPTSQSPEL